jgi:F-type H+-transporting ATPase subunit epsilon
MPLTCIVVTPEATALEQEADFIALPLYDGEIGIAPGHSPMIGRLGYGEMRVRRGGEVSRYYVDGGFVQVASDVVSVLTNRAVPAGQLNVQAASEQLAAARSKVASSEEALAIRERQVTQARAQLRVAERAH